MKELQKEKKKRDTQSNSGLLILAQVMIFCPLSPTSHCQLNMELPKILSPSPYAPPLLLLLSKQNKKKKVYYDCVIVFLKERKVRDI